MNGYNIPINMNMGNQQPFYGYGYAPQPRQFERLQTLENQQRQIQTQVAYVNGIEGAKAYILQPNSNAILLDSDSDYMYCKVADSSGIMSLDTFKLTKVEPQTMNNTQINTNYVTKEEFNTLQNQLKNLQISLGVEPNTNESVGEMNG